MNLDQEQQLEELFLKAFHEPAYRQAFIQQLLEANVYIPGTSNRSYPDSAPEEIHYFETEQNEKLHFKVWPDDEYGQVIPFFSSLPKMRQVMPPEENFLSIPCAILFEMTLGSKLILNPQSEVSKAFTPEEVQAILAGDYSGGVHEPENHQIEENTQILIGQPENMPDFMLQQVSIVLQLYPAVQAAYFAQIWNQTTQAMPSYVVALYFDDTIEEDALLKLHKHISGVAYESMQEKRNMDVLHLYAGQKLEGIEAYFVEETEAFYQRPAIKKKGFFARLFS